MIIRDRFALGALAAQIATIPQLLLNVCAVQLGFTKYYSFQISGSIYLFKKLTLTPGGILLEILTWILMAAILGIITSYIIFWTGKDFWWLKGAIVSNAIMYTMVYGFIFAMGGPKIIPWDLGTNLSLFFDNLVFGILTGYLVAHWSVPEPNKP